MIKYQNIKKSKSELNFSRLLFYFIFILLFVLTNNSSFAESTINNTLWNKSVELCEKNKIYFPHEIVSNTIERDPSGKIISDLKIYIKPQPDENIMKGVTKVIKDGKDITTNYRKKTKKIKSKLLMLKDLNLLFYKESQKNIEITPDSESYISGKKCQIYDFYFSKDKKEHYKGKAWIEESSGIPLKLDFTFDPLPFGVRELNIVYLYHKVDSTDFYLENIKVDVDLYLLFFHRDYSLSVDFKDYYKIKS